MRLTAYLLRLVCFNVVFTLSISSDCNSYRTGTAGKYRYPIEKLKEDITTFEFSVNVMKYAYITLSPDPWDTTDQYEIAIGNSEQANTAAIRRCRQCDDRRSVTTQYRLLVLNEFKLFWVQFQSGRIQFGRYNESALLSWRDRYPLDIRYIGIATGVGYSGDFIFCDDRFGDRPYFSFEGMFGIFAFFLPPTLIFMRFLWRKLIKNIKLPCISNNNEDTEVNDGFTTARGLHNTTWRADPDLPSYEKCMEDGGYRLCPVGGGASALRDEEEPPSYESVMRNCLFQINHEEYLDFNQERNSDRFDVQSCRPNSETYV